MTAIDTELARTRRQPIPARDPLPDNAGRSNADPCKGRADG
jgi:hypothetical protein